MSWRIGEKFFDDAYSLFARSLILFKNDRDTKAWFDVGSGSVRHEV